MSGEKIVHLVNLSTGQVVASLSDEQLETLKKYFEVESGTDTNFYASLDTVEFLREQDAGELAGLIERALGGAQEVQLGYAAVPVAGSGLVRGRLLGLEAETPLIGYKIEAYDQDIALDDFLGWCYTDSQGRFELHFDESDFKDPAALDLEGEPELKLRIVNVEGEKVGWVGILRGNEVDFRDIFLSARGKLSAPVLDPGTIAICPSCGTPYRSVSVTCSDCQVPVRPLKGVTAV